MTQETFSGREVLITGGTKGLGLALVHQLIDHGCRVTVLARHLEPLNDLLQAHQNSLRAISADIGDRKSVAAALAEVDAIDTLILNAGTCEYLTPGQVNAEACERVIDVNVLGAANVLESSLDKLAVSTRAPQVVGISSLVTEMPLSRAEVYGASKAALDYFLESLRVDVYHKGIDVTVIKPGFIKTPLTDKNDFPMPFLMSAEQAASAVMKAIVQRRYLYKFPWQLAFSLRLGSLLPTGLQVKLLQKMVKRG
ncbi:SDR family NAD(P)-dependent oxidoreductase [Gilvimarinus xylanilyticus]|uniref:SDR family NAD(P)-dependent oxidoreductase n=1 Tax=Gilvimarinus xylanilyticus TaxID=2944139 RepID=A0A9X2HXK8_9GAMM|nr:SDR family NAD(P)-dependent oxidoreductase [Gilvimarinus xylanilyticus]MCP8898411.1 SDR family NAD(P)-dependent oxidoreductase [Gilvimarinus xylanilyticus]